MRVHISTQELALFARGDLGFWRRRSVAAHVRRCEECAGIAADVAHVGEGVRALSANLPPDMSERDWDRLSAEMTANIRLGIAAGECVSRRFGMLHMPSRPKLAVGLAVLGIISFVAGIERLRPVTRAVAVAADAVGPTLESDSSGVELRSGGRSLGVRTPAGRDLVREVSLRGESRARYVDGSGVTIVNVIAE